ncbi:MAG: stage III sporulation protein AB [Clostridiales bacterium]|nr:stage III sporulation protein AB [Clostridiales bacterium]
MLKAVGALIVLFACGTAGCLFAGRLTRRVKHLQQLQRGFLALATEIGYTSTALVPALETASRQAEGDMGELFGGAARRLHSAQGKSAEEAWRQTVEQTGLRFGLPGKDKEVLAAFGLGLGLSDRTDQLKRLELTRLRLSSLEEEAREDKQKLGKVWQALGWGAGFALVLLLL